MAGSAGLGLLQRWVARTGMVGVQLRAGPSAQALSTDAEFRDSRYRGMWVLGCPGGAGLPGVPCWLGMTGAGQCW